MAVKNPFAKFNAAKKSKAKGGKDAKGAKAKDKKLPPWLKGKVK
jgi:hypothetical protein